VNQAHLFESIHEERWAKLVLGGGTVSGQEKRDLVKIAQL